MSRTVERKGEASPGFEWVEMNRGVDLLLPIEAASEARALMRRRADEVEERAREQARLRQDERVAAALREHQAAIPLDTVPAKASAKPRTKKTLPQPKRGWYRVLPGIDAIKQELDGTKAMTGHSDKEHSERLQKTRQQLLALGPDRKFSMPRHWRTGLDRLAVEMPHFREPLDLARGSLALAEATGRAVRIPPMLLLGPAGVGKTHFSHRLAELLGTSHRAIAFDQPSYGGQLRGTDSAWSNTQTGLLFNLVALGEHANPVILLDELDKACPGSTRHEIDPLAQLHGALEPESARRIMDISVHVEFDASMVTYIGTANSIRGLESPILSRFEIFQIEPPQPADCVVMAGSIVAKTLDRLGLTGRVSIERQAVLLLAHLSPRLLTRSVEKAVAQAVIDGRDQVRESDIWSALRIGVQGPPLH